MLKAYAVTYKIEGNESEFSANCTIGSAYGTTFGDIPQMISVRRDCEVEQIEILTLRLLFVDDKS